MGFLRVITQKENDQVERSKARNTISSKIFQTLTALLTFELQFLLIDQNIAKNAFPIAVQVRAES